METNNIIETREKMNLYELNIASLGFGNMQRGIMQQLFDKKIVDKNKYTAIVHRPESRDKLADSGMKATLDHTEIQNADVIFLAYKPKDFWNEEIHKNLHGKIVVSIMAGVKDEDISKKFIGAEIFQVMPNRGSVVGEGCTFLKFPQGMNAEKKEFIKKFFSPSSDVYEVKNSAELNKGIITSASMFGVIAFFRDKIHNTLKLAEKDDVKSRDFFRKFEKIIENIAKKHDFLPENAQEIAKKTFQGVEALAKEFEYIDIQASVTSKNGTTHAMITYLENNEIEEFLEGVFATEKVLEGKALEEFIRLIERSCAAGLIRARELSKE